MPIFEDDTPPVVAPPKAPPIQTVAPSHSGVAVDTRYVPAETLMTHVEGMSWTLDAYYQQVLGLDSPLSGLQLNLSPRQQQYTCIKNLELKVTQDMKPTQDTETGAFVGTGSANVFGGLIPNVGDMFVASNADGRRVIYRLTESKKNSMLKGAVYSIDYIFAYFAEDVYLKNLADKTIRTLVFRSDYLNYGQSPFMEEQEHNDLARLEVLYESVMRMWFRSFLSNEYSTLLLPGQESRMYDHFITKAVQAVFSTWETPEVRRIRRLNVDDDETMNGYTLWDVIMNCDRFMFQEAIKRVGAVYTSRFTQNPVLEGIRYSGAQSVVYPIDPIRSFDYQRVDKQKLVDQDLLLRPTMLLVEPGSEAPLIKPVTTDDYYVLSQAFYEQSEGQSKLEVQVNNFIDNKAVDQRVLIALAETYTGWGALERFYYGALLLVLTKVSLRSR